MSTRTPERTLQKFDHRAGTEEVPLLGGMSRVGDEASIPARQHHLLVNIRFGPGEMGSRPGLVETDDVGVAQCITGLIETSENTGSGGPLRGLLMGFYGGIARAGNPYWYHLGPEVPEPYDVSDLSSVGVTMVPRDTTAAYLYESTFPLAGVRYVHRPVLPGSVPTYPTNGPFFPFRFQGKTCALGRLGADQVCIFSITGNATGTDGNVGVIAIIGTTSTISPQSVAIRQEIIGGQILDVLYIGAFDKVMRFDGTTLTEWFANPSLSPGTLHVYASGQEILILHNASTFIDDDATIYYQPAPGQAITAATLPADLFKVVADPPFDDFGGWTGACKFRNTWVVTLEGGIRSPVAGVPRTPFGRVITATSGGASLTFATAYTNGPGVALDGNVYYHIGWPIVWQDQIVFMAAPTLILNSNGNFTWDPDTGTGAIAPVPITIGNYTDANGWQIPAIGGPEQKPGTPLEFGSTDGYYQSVQHGWHLSVGNSYVHSQAIAGSYEKVQGLAFPDSKILVPGAVGPTLLPGWIYDAWPLGSNQVAFFDDEEEA